MEKQSKISLNLILAGLFGWVLLANSCGKPAGSDEIITKGTALGDKTVGEPCEDCVSPGSRSALLLAAAKNQQSNAYPANIADPIVEKAVREELKKPTGELTKADLEKVTQLFFAYRKLTEVPKDLEKLTQLQHLNLGYNKLTDVTGLEKLTKLEVLLLSENKLTELPKGLEKLTQSETLYLDVNKPTDVKGLEKLTQLTWLYLGGNQLTSVKGLEKLTKLTHLNLRDNPALTKAQIDQLQKALPKCKISSNPTK